MSENTSSSSKRVRFAADCVDKTDTQKHKNSQRKYIRNKKFTLKGIHIIPESFTKNISIESCKTKLHYFFSSNYKCISNKVKTECNLSDFQQINTTSGCAIFDEKKNPIFVLIPRSTSMQSKGKNQLKKHITLMKNLMKEKGIHRGKKEREFPTKKWLLGLNPQEIIMGSLNLT